MNPSPLAALHGIDGAIVAAYLLLLAGIGVYFSRQQDSLQDFIRSRSRYGWLTIGLSLMAALNSGIDYIQAPAIVFALGLVYAMSFLSWIPLYPWISRVTLPFYQRLDVYSAYEYLEYRFSPAVRVAAAGIFLLWRIGWMGTAIYVPCLAVNAVAGGGLDVPLMVVVLGTVVTLYTMLGGVKAVIWTDVAQFCVMFGGLAATLVVVVNQIPGGFGEIWRLAAEQGRLSLTGPALPEGGGPGETLRAYFATEMTLVGVVLMVFLSRMTAFTADQIAIQRFQSCASLADARRSYLANVFTSIVWIAVLGVVGLALFAYYQHHPFPAGLRNDRVLPQFMLEHFPVGITGLVIAAIFAASLSSVDSALNAGASIVMVDFYHRLWLGRIRPSAEVSPAEERRQLRISRGATLILGAIMIALGANVGRLGELYQAANKLLGAFFGPLLGIFVLGMFCRRAHAAGVMVGALAGLSASCFCSFFSALPWLQALSGRVFGEGFVHFFRHLSWQWPSPIGVVVTLLLGYAASRLLPTRQDPAAALTFARVMARPVPGSSPPSLASP